LAESITAVRDVPGFDRAAMDGYAVRGEETFGSEPAAPLRFRVVGEARPGRAFEGEVRSGEAVDVTTGAPLPRGADAVVPVEQVRSIGCEIEVTEGVSPGRHVSSCGEDVRAGETVFRASRRLRPQDLGIASVLGLSELPVVREPRVAIVVTGDELLEPGREPEGYRFADMNSVMLAPLVLRDGGVVGCVLGPMPDDEERLRGVLMEAASAHDVVLITGGSSAGREDHVPGLVRELGELAVHGVALRPASPTGLGRIGGALVCLLPGNPVSCLCAYDFFAGRGIRRLAGRGVCWPYRWGEGVLGEKLASMVGRVDYARVRLEGGRVWPLAISGASILSTTTRADGFVVIGEGSEGEAAGAVVRVWHYDE
jgi:molybdopterin molybdotransferase